MKPGPAGPTTVTLRTTAAALAGTPKLPATLTLNAPPAAMVLPLHWEAGGLRPEGFPPRVSQIRTGASGL